MSEILNFVEYCAYLRFVSERIFLFILIQCKQKILLFCKMAMFVEGRMAKRRIVLAKRPNYKVLQMLPYLLKYLSHHKTK